MTRMTKQSPKLKGQIRQLKYICGRIHVRHVLTLLHFSQDFRLAKKETAGMTLEGKPSHQQP